MDLVIRPRPDVASRGTFTAPGHSLLRLKELESLKDIAARINEVRVVVGANGLETLLPAGLLVGGANGESSHGAMG